MGRRKMGRNSKTRVSDQCSVSEQSSQAQTPVGPQLTLMQELGYQLRCNSPQGSFLNPLTSFPRIAGI